MYCIVTTLVRKAYSVLLRGAFVRKSCQCHADICAQVLIATITNVLSNLLTQICTKYTRCYVKLN